jgi:hypothetical protein
MPLRLAFFGVPFFPSIRSTWVSFIAFRDLNGDEPARQRQVHVAGLISLRRVERGEDELEVGRYAHDVPGPNEFVEFRLNEGVRPVEFIEEGGFGLPNREGGGDELEDPSRMRSISVRHRQGLRVLELQPGITV